jgi:hypothetical protein
MTDLSALVGGMDRYGRPPVARARVKRAPQNQGDALTVWLVNYSPDFAYEIPGSNWMPIGPAMPQAGDGCVVCFDDDGDAWVVSWDVKDQELGGVAPEIEPLPLFRAVRTTDLTTVAGWRGPLLFNSEVVDTDDWFDPATGKFQPTEPGWYRLGAGIATGTGIAATDVYLFITKNATGINTSIWANVIAVSRESSPNASTYYLSTSGMAYFNGTTDYAEVRYYFGTASGTPVVYGTGVGQATFFEGHAIRGLAGPEGPPWVPSEYDQTGWQTFAEAGIVFGAGWRAYNGNETWEWAPRVRKKFDGTLEFRGLIDKTGGNFAANETMFTLPDGMKPSDSGFAGSDIFETPMMGATTEGRGQVRIYADGRVQIGTYGGPSNPVGWVSLRPLTVETSPAGPVLAGAIGPEGPPWVPSEYTLDTWHNFTGVGGNGGFYNSAVNLDNNAAVPSATPTHRNAGYRKYPDGRVKLRGIIKAGLSNAVALLLPPGYRPSTTSQNFLQYASGGVAHIQIDPSGNVTPVNLTGTVTTWIFLDGIEFDTDSVTTMLAGVQGPSGGPVPTGGVAGQLIRKLSAVDFDVGWVGDTGWLPIGAVGSGLPATFLGSWTNLGNAATYPQASYRKDASGVVHLKGLIAGGASGQSMIQLPAGYGHNDPYHFHIHLNSGGSSQQGSILANGQVQINGVYSGWVDLASVPKWIGE